MTWQGSFDFSLVSTREMGAVVGVISADTAVAHLAGALGVLTWTLLPYVPDWRGLLQRRDTPWYPTMRLFRQHEYGNWQHVFERVAQELHADVEHGVWDKRLADS